MKSENEMAKFINKMSKNIHKLIKWGDGGLRIRLGFDHKIVLDSVMISKA